MEKKPFEYYAHALGGHELDIMQKAGVPTGLRKTIRRGGTIAQPHAEALAKYISQEIGRPIRWQDISDIKVL